MTKLATTTDGQTTTFDTDELTGVFPRGDVDGKSVVKVARGEKPTLYVFGTTEDIVSADPDITV